MGSIGERYVQSFIIILRFPADCIAKAWDALKGLVAMGFVITKTPSSLEYVSINPSKLEDVKRLIRSMENE